MIEISSRHFRDVLSQVATGVSVVTSRTESGEPIGMAVGSFASVSLDPPLVSFMAAKSSSTFPRIARSGQFAVSVLAAHQEHVCRQFATSSGDKFQGLEWTLSDKGCPLIPGALAWIECDIVALHEAGDHMIAVGAVTALEASEQTTPLVFFRGGYGKFAARSLVAVPDHGLADQLALAGRTRLFLEELATTTGLEAHAETVVGNHHVLLAVADPPSRDYPASRLGYRAPVVYPLGGAMIAWADAAAQQAWIAHRPNNESAAQSQLERVRRRRWSVALAHHAYDAFEHEMANLARDAVSPLEDERTKDSLAALDSDCFEPELAPDRLYSVRLISAPVLPWNETPALVIGLRGFPDELTGKEVAGTAERVVHAADQVARKLRSRPGGAVPSRSRPTDASDAPARFTSPHRTEPHPK